MDTSEPRPTAKDKRNHAATNPSRYKIDVGRYVAEMEERLCNDGDSHARLQTLAILQRWQFDKMLDDASRERAKLLVLRFGRDEWRGMLDGALANGRLERTGRFR
jgi:hypothetical protein